MKNNRLSHMFFNTVFQIVLISYFIGLVSCDPVDPEPNFPDDKIEENGDTLYNGIVLPMVWPPKNINIGSYIPMRIPYLENPPTVIPINIGRQLFVDDFLIETVDGLERVFYQAKKIPENPILKAETGLEKSSIPGVSLKDGGVWWDEEGEEFKMWYEAGWLNAMAFATSKDGLIWTKPSLDIGNLNQILVGIVPNSCSVIVDYDTSGSEKYKLFLRSPNANATDNAGYCMTSSDGIDWKNMVKTGPCGDRSTMFYNPFRKKYVFSIRSLGVLGTSPHGRARYYRECSDFLLGAEWTKDDVVFWTNADNRDDPDSDIGIKTELYNLNAVGYESIMLGLHQIFLGPQNEDTKELGRPKITELKISFSRDGFHWDRPNRNAFIGASRVKDSWDRGYIQSTSGICTVIGDELRFYYSGFQGDESRKGTSYGMHSNGAIGIAVLRRDGFASMSTADEGYLITRSVVFSGKHLFVNVDCPEGKLSVEILDKNNEVLSNFTEAKCQPVSVNSTIQQIEWDDVSDLSSLVGKEVRFKFNISNGDLYSFWVSSSSDGESNGYVAGGGPGYATSLDDQGKKAYEKSKKLLTN